MKQKSIKKNMFMNVLLTMSNFLFPLITFGYVSRTLTPINTGKVAFVSSVIQYFSYIAIIGIPAYGLREAAKVREDKDKLSKLVHELLFISIITTLISYILLTLSVILVSKFNEYKYLFLIMSLSIGLNTIGLEWLYNALEEYSYITIRSLIFKLLYIPLVFLLIHEKSDYLIYGFLSIFVTSANYICNFINIRKFISFKKYDNYSLKRHLKPIFILFSASIIISIYANFDVIMIGFIKSESDVGLYNAALKIKSIVLSLSTSITAVLVPRITSYIGKKDYDAVKNLVVKSFRVSMLLAFPVAIYTLFFSKNILLLISGSEYVAATSTLQVLMLCVLFLVLTNLFGNQLLIPLGKEKKFTQSVFVGLFINIILNLLLIGKYGAFGAAIGTLVTEFWNTLYMSLNVKEYLIHIIRNSKFFKYLIAAVPAIAISIMIRYMLNGISNFVIILITGTIFVILYYVLLLVQREGLETDIINWSKKLKKRL